MVMRRGAVVPRQRRRSAVALATVVTLLALTTGCGGVGSGDSGGEQTLTTMGFGLPDEIAKVRVDQFKEANPKVKVKITEGGFDEQQFLSSVASGNPADVVYMDRASIGTYAARGALQPMDDCLRGHDMAQYREAARLQVTVDGKVYGVPEFYNVLVLIINNKALKAAGLTPADVSTTDWQKLAGVTTKLTKRTGGKLTRIGFDPKIPEFLPLWARANNAEFLSGDGKQAKLDDPKVVEALTYTADLVKRQGGWSAMKSFRDSFDFFGAKNQYASDQLGAMPMEQWYLNVLADVSPDVDITVAPYTDRAGAPFTYATGSAWVIPKGAKNKDAACRFAKTMTEKDTWVTAAKARAKALRAEKKAYTGTYTGNIAADKEIFEEVFEPTGRKTLDDAVKTVLSVQDAAFSLPPSPAGAEFQQAYLDAVNRVLAGQQTPQQALRQAQQQAQQALDKASKDD